MFLGFVLNVLIHGQYLRPFYKNFQGFTYCSVFKVRVVVFATARLLYHGVSLLSTTFLKSFFRISHAVSKDALCLTRVVDVRSTKLDAVSLRFANDLALSSCFAFTKLLSVKDKAYLSTTFDKSQHLFVEIFPIVLTAYANYKKNVVPCARYTRNTTFLN